MGLTATFSLSASGVLTKDDLVSIVNDPVSAGGNSFPPLSFDLTDGTGSGQANKWYRALKTIGAGATASIDLNGGSDKDPFGTGIVMTRVVALVVAISEPNGTKSVRVGPQGGANAWVGPFNANSSSVLIKYWQVFADYSSAGWPAVAGTSDTLYLYNPGGSSIDVAVWVIGS